MRTYLLIPFLALLASCVAAPAPEHQGEWVEGAYCETGVFKLDVDFSGANMAACDILDERTIAIDLKPEDVPINASPWYAVRLTPSQPGNVKVVLRYEEHPHRYKPKISHDTQTWINPGGDFMQEASAEITVDSVGNYTIESTEALVRDVQEWLDNPDVNFGWIMTAGESGTTAKRFNSRENSTPEHRPRLTLWYVTDDTVFLDGFESLACP